MNQARALTEMLVRKISEKLSDDSFKDSNFYLAISGGASPKNLFSLWTTDYLDKIPWGKIELFWVDERCVSPLDIESNYGIAKKQLLDFVPIPEFQIHRIIGEDDPEIESKRYSKLVMETLPAQDGVPIFDFIVLGIGEDGHTSSIFPDQHNLLVHGDTYVPSENPNTGQKRVAMTGLPIINSKLAAYYLVGKSKTAIMDNIANSNGSQKFPAGYLIYNGKNSRIFWDR